jgi:hypothetical protein
LPPLPAETDGLELTELVWTAPVELPAELPPPTCTAPTEFEAVLLPEPPTDVGAETLALAVVEPAVTDGLTDVLPA